MNLVVGDGDRLAHALVHRAGLALEPRAQHRQRERRGLAAGRLAADAVDDHEDAARGVDVEAILVDVAHAGRDRWRPRRGRQAPRLRSWSSRRPSGPDRDRGGRRPAPPAARTAPGAAASSQRSTRKSRNTALARPMRARSGSDDFDAVLALAAVDLVEAARHRLAVHGGAERAQIDEAEAARSRRRDGCARARATRPARTRCGCPRDTSSPPRPIDTDALMTAYSCRPGVVFVREARQRARRLGRRDHGCSDRRQRRARDAAAAPVADGSAETARRRQRPPSADSGSRPAAASAAGRPPPSGSPASPSAGRCRPWRCAWCGCRAPARGSPAATAPR